MRGVCRHFSRKDTSARALGGGEKSVEECDAFDFKFLSG